MEKTSTIEMDLGEWEFLPDSKSFLEFGHEGGKEICFGTKGIVDMNYFICPSPTSRCTYAEEENLKPASDIKQARRPAGPEPMVERKNRDGELAKEFEDIGVMPPTIIANHDAVSQVFFKVKENEFVDMKMNSPKSNTRGIIPHIEPEPIRFNKEEEEEEVEDCKIEETERKTSKNSAFEEEVERDEDHLESQVKGKPCWESFGFNMGRWRSTGIGAVCSIGVAAATFCIFILGGRQRQKQLHQNQRIQFQIYADDKRIERMMQQATRLNQALSVARGAPITRAQNVARISFGGYHDGL